jgi:hypothetical protein
MIRAPITIPTQSVGVNADENTQNALAKLDKIVIDWRHHQGSILCDLHSELAFSIS